MEWLAGSRLAQDITEDLAEAFVAALPHLSGLAELMASIITSGDVDPDASWWLHQIGAEQANSELRLTSPGLAVESVGESEASWMLSVNGREVATTLDEGFLDGLSSAERRWADEAFASVSRQIADQGARSQWQQFFWSQAEGAGDDEAVEELSGNLADTVDTDGS